MARSEESKFVTLLLTVIGGLLVTFFGRLLWPTPGLNLGGAAAMKPAQGSPPEIQPQIPADRDQKAHGDLDTTPNHPGSATIMAPANRLYCCYLAHGWTDPFRVAVGGLPDGVTSSMVLSGLSDHFRTASNGDGAYILRLSVQLDSEIVRRDLCANINAVKVTIGASFEDQSGRKINGAHEPATVSGFGCFGNTDGDAERAATDQATANLASALAR